MYAYKNPITRQTKYSKQDMISAQQRRDFLGLTEPQLESHFWSKYGQTIKRRQQLEEAGFGQHPNPAPSKQAFEQYERTVMSRAGQQPKPLPSLQAVDQRQQQYEREFWVGVGQQPIPRPSYIPPTQTTTERNIYPSTPTSFDPVYGTVESKMKGYQEREALKDRAKAWYDKYGLYVPATYKEAKPFIGLSPTEVAMKKAQLAEDPLSKFTYEFTGGFISPYESMLSLIPNQSFFKYQPTFVGGAVQQFTMQEQTVKIPRTLQEYYGEFKGLSPELEYMVKHPAYSFGSLVSEATMGYGLGKGIEAGGKVIAPALRITKASRPYQALSSKAGAVRQVITKRLPKTNLFMHDLPSGVSWKPTFLTKTDYYGYKPTRASEEILIIQRGKDITEAIAVDLRLTRTPISYKDYLKLGKVKPKTLEIQGGQFTAVSTPSGDVAYPQYIKGYQRAEEALGFVKDSKWGHRAKYLTYADEAYPETGFMKGYKFFDERLGRATQTAYAYTFPSDVTTSYLVKGNRELLSKLGRPPTKESVQRLIKLKRTRTGVKIESLAKRKTLDAEPFAIFGKRKLRIDRIWGDPVKEPTVSTGFIPSTVKPKPSTPPPKRPFSYLGRWEDLRKGSLKTATTTKMETPLVKGTGSVEQRFLGAEAITKTRPTTSLMLGASTKTAYNFGYGRVPISKVKPKIQLLQYPKFQPLSKQGLSEIPAFEFKTKTRVDTIPKPKLGEPLKFVPSFDLGLDRVPWQTPKQPTPQLHRIPVPEKTLQEGLPLMAIPGGGGGRIGTTILPKFKTSRKRKRTKLLRQKGYRLKIHPIGEIKL